MVETPERIVEAYLARLTEIRSTGGATSETSYYSALEALLNHVGKTLDPHVVCNGQLRNQGAGCDSACNLHADLGSVLNAD